MKDIKVICPTLRSATEYFRKFCNKNHIYISKAYRSNCRVELINGVNVYFVATQRELLGWHGATVSIDEFPMEVNL